MEFKTFHLVAEIGEHPAYRDTRDFRCS